MRRAPSGLNPCFSGCWSRTRPPEEGGDERVGVLILVLVDVGLGRPIDIVQFFV